MRKYFYALVLAVTAAALTIPAVSADFPWCC
jgi:hypothetical protein